MHKLILENRRTTILEFGNGWSTWVIADALYKLKRKYGEVVRSMRRNNPFELHVIDDQPKYMKIAYDRIPSHLRPVISMHSSTVEMNLFNGKICHFYNKLPLINPDLIYVDGPDQFEVVGDINGISTRQMDMLPMSGDVCRFEHFLLPGSIVLFDGRSANARFFLAESSRNWNYVYSPDIDQHYFHLNEAPFGRHNQLLLDFYNGGSV